MPHWQGNLTASSRATRQKVPTVFPRPQGSTTPIPLKSQEYQVRKVLKAVNPNKAAEPDVELGKVLKVCADQGSWQGSPWNRLLSQLAATILPIPQKISHKLRQWLQTGCTDLCSYDVLWEAHHTLSQIVPPFIPLKPTSLYNCVQDNKDYSLIHSFYEFHLVAVSSPIKLHCHLSLFWTPGSLF